LAAKLTTDFGLGYSALSLPGPTSDAPDFPLTNSILIDSARVQTETLEAVAGCSAQDFGVDAPGVCPAGEFPVFERPPLLARLVVGGSPGTPWPNTASLWVIDNHWKSKSGDENANIPLRAAQATAVAARVQAVTAADPDAQIVVLGDLNDYYDGAAVSTLQSATPLIHAYQWLPALDRYSYNFNGAAQVLDHLLVTPNLAPQLSLVRILHLYSDAPTGDSTLAHSDHDPVIVYVRPTGAALISGRLNWEGIELNATDGSGTLLAQATTDANGDFRLWGLPLGKATLQLNAPDWIVLDDPAHLFSRPLSHPLTWSVDAVAGVQTPALPRVRHTTAMTGAWLALSTPWLADTLIQLH
jgi:hypothetical protein